MGWQGVGKINVTGEYQTASSEFSLREDTTPQEIWGNGFKNITNEVLDNSFDIDDDKIDETIYKIIDNLKNEFAIKKIIDENNEEIRKEVREIADLIKRTPKININKYKAAAAIYLIRNSGYKNSNELTNCLINNLNQLVERFENDLPEGEYEMSIYKDNDCHYDGICNSPEFTIEIYSNSGIEDLLINMGYPYSKKQGEENVKLDANIDNIDAGFQKLYSKLIR